MFGLKNKLLDNKCTILINKTAKKYDISKKNVLNIMRCVKDLDSLFKEEKKSKNNLENK